MSVEVYKVVKVMNDGRLESAVIGFYEPSLRTIYNVGEVTRPPVGRLFAFDRFDNALRFANSHTSTRVYVARCGNSYPITTQLPEVRGGCGHWMRLFWKGLFKSAQMNGPAPVGTVSCDYIQLVRPA